MKILKYKTVEGGYEGLDGTFYPELIDLVQEYLDFCGCGDSTGNAKYILRGLEYIKTRINLEYKDTIQKDIEIFGSEESALFFFYWAHSMDFVDHGTSLHFPWLSETGKDFISDLKEILKDED